MSDVPRQALKQIVQQYGRDVYRDPRRCEGLLRDLAGEHKREIFVLISALEEGSVDDLLTAERSLPLSVVLPRLAAELHEATALSQEAATWAIAAWAEALGIASGSAGPPLPAASSSLTGTTDRLRLIHRWTAHRGEVGGLAFSPDGQQLASVGLDAAAHIWNVASAEERLGLTHQTGILTSVAWQPDGLAIALGSGDAGIYLWHWVDIGQEIRRLRGHKQAVTGVGFLPDGQKLASCGRDGLIHLWDLDDGTPQTTLRGHTDAVLGLALSPDGHRLATAGGWDRTVRVWNLEQGRELLTLNGHAAQVTSVSFAPQGRLIASGAWDETVRVWRTDQGREVWRLSKGDQAIHLVSSVAFGPRGRILASGDWSGKVNLWSASQGGPLGTVSEHEGHVRAVAFSRRGQWLASADDVGVVCLWQVND
ncbi:MAG: WD40 repeat domain-containing protein [Anaerolineae bacterium]